MANITAGFSGMATVGADTCGGLYAPGIDHWIVKLGGTTVATESTPNGWSVSPTGSIGVPVGATPGSYTATCYASPLTTCLVGGIGGNTLKNFSFDVVAAETSDHTKYYIVCPDAIGSVAAGDPLSPTVTYYDSIMEASAARAEACGAGRYLCGDCGTLDPSAVEPAGYATSEECAAACATPGGDGDNPDCHLTGYLSYARVSGDQYRITAHVSGATDLQPIFWHFQSGSLMNETDTTVLVNVPSGTTFGLFGKATDGDSLDGCSLEMSLDIDGSTETGTTPCNLKVNLKVVDKADGTYTAIAETSGAADDSTTFTFLVHGSVTAPDGGTNNQVTFSIPFADSSTVAVVAINGTCADGTTVTIVNSDSGLEGGGTPGTDPGLPSDCASRLGIYYRDIKADTTVPGAVIWNARIGLEVHPACDNPACWYWFQLFDSSDASLFEVYTPDALKAHFPLALGYGESMSAFGDRIERYQIQTSAISRPATTHKHLRIKATPVYVKEALELDGNAIKIRDYGARSLFIFTDTAKAYRWDAPAAGELGSGSVALLVDLVTLTPAAGDATDAAVVDNKLYVVAPGELFAVDLDTGDQTLNSGIRSESKTPTFVEVVGGKPLALYIGGGSTTCYDLSFPTPRLKWTLAHVVTATQVTEIGLSLAVGTDLYTSAGGTATPTLAFSFPATITALATNYIGLSNNAVYKLKSTGWALATNMLGPVGALWEWFGGAAKKRGLAGASSGTSANVLRAEQTNLFWANDQELTDATGVLSMRALTVETTPATDTTPAINDEWMLIGDDNEKLWVYSRSAISEADGAFKACSIAVPRITPRTRPLTS